MVKFECQEDATLTGFCIFHQSVQGEDPQHDQSCQKRLQEKIQESISGNGILYCIGYQLPSVTIREDLPKLMYFKNCNIRSISGYGPINSRIIFSGTEFMGYVDFVNSEFKKQVDFSQCKFRNGASFSEAKFKSSANFAFALFESDAEFSKCEFSEVNFSDSNFSKMANFIETRFNKLANFRYAKFKNSSEFARALFKSKVDFYGTSYDVAADFMFTEFLEGADFNACGFSAGSNFGDAIFHKAVVFTGSGFGSTAVFLNTIFGGAADFIGVRFESVTAFNNATFNSKGNFSQAVFKNQTLFQNCIFKDDVDFSRIMSTYILFSNSNFLGLTNFKHSGFMNEGNFSNATFYGIVEFDDSHFHGEAIFSPVIFTKQVSFSRTQFHEKTVFSKCMFKDTSYFNDILFSDGERIYFDVGDLSSVSFLNTDITRVRFGESVVWGDRDPFTVYDEMLLKKGLARYLFSWNLSNNKIERNLLEFLNNSVGLGWVEESCQLTNTDIDRINIFPEDRQHSVQFDLDKHRSKVTMKIDNEQTEFEFGTRNESNTWKVYLIERPTVGGVRAIYRNLRENYEFRLRYDEAGEFFIREMELKRKFRDIHSKDGLKVKSNSWIRRNLSLIGLYYNLSTYGQSIIKPISLGIGVFAISFSYWLFYSDPYPSSISHDYIGWAQLSNMTHISSAFERSVNSFIPFLPIGINPTMSDIAVRVSGFVGLGLLVIALRRKFERKFRH